MAAELDKMVQEVLEEILGVDVDKLGGVDFFDAVQNPKGYVPKAKFQVFDDASSRIALSNQMLSDPRLNHPLDVRYRIAHEAGHAKDFYGRAKGDVNSWIMTSPARKEVLADSAAMNYFRKHGYKFGPAMAAGAAGPPPSSAYRFFGPMAKRFGLSPLFVMSLLTSVGLMGEE